LITSFSGTFAAVILALIIISMLILSTYWYFNERNQIASNFNEHHNMTLEMLHQATIWIDRGVILYEEAYEPPIIEVMNIYQEAYSDAEGNIDQMNLSQVKNQTEERMSGEWDFYLIDNGVVVKTTFPDDFGLDFKKYPELYQKYMQFQETGDLVIDRTVKGWAKGAPNRKFAYQGTPDKRYLLEISKNFDQFKPENSKATYKELVTTTTRQNPYIRSIDLYNSLFSVIASYSTDSEPKRIIPDVKSHIKSAFKNQSSFLIVYPEHNVISEFLFLPIEDSGAPSTSQMHQVGHIIYSTEIQDSQFFHITVIYFGIVIFAALVALLTATAISRHLIRPLTQIGDDIDKIASGDLDHHITSTGAVETERIEQSISTMVERLKSNIEELRVREERLSTELAMRKRAQNKYRRLFDLSHEAIFIIENTLIKDCNRECCQLLGRNRNEIIGKSLDDFAPESKKHQIRSVISSYIRTDIILKNYDTIEEDIREAIDPLKTESRTICSDSLEWQFKKPDETIIETQVYIKMISFGESNIIQVMVRDVTELNEMHRRENIAIAQLEENLAQLATINDQIRNPLTVITLYTDILDLENKNKIHEQVHRINNLIDEIDKGFVATDKVRMFLLKHHNMFRTKKRSFQQMGDLHTENDNEKNDLR
jgi:PAS domain-containing protein